MTETEAYFSRLAFKQPFASKDGADKATISNTSADNAVNFPDGFPSVYSAGNGKYVTRAEMNAIGNLASQNQFFFLAGGINTFNKSFSDAIGGYPKNAVLKYLYNGFLYDVISLRDNNTFDFTINGVDDINWAYLSVPAKSVFSDIFFEGGTGITTGSAILGIVKAKKTSGLILESSLSPVIGESKAVYNDSSPNNFETGCGLMIKEFDSLPTEIILPSCTPDINNTKVTISFENFRSLSGNFQFVCQGSLTGFTNGVMRTPQYLAGSFSSVTKDKYYAIIFLCGLGEYTHDQDSKEVTVNLYTSLSGSVKLTYAQ